MNRWARSLGSTVLLSSLTAAVAWMATALSFLMAVVSENHPTNPAEIIQAATRTALAVGNLLFVSLAVWFGFQSLGDLPPAKAVYSPLLDLAIGLGTAALFATILAVISGLALFYRRLRKGG